ncbi:Rossmann-like and DUF2520 domain-containing protein [Pectinatus sottacetonis]|uniref:Rossmann-like and DUF2520 domain-containing protein n=1 Tax=Pectinatus sottacetonis TaxID=1002795 RepID=UPI002EDAB579
MYIIKIGFIGAGKVGTTLGLYFQKHALPLAGYYSRSQHSRCNAAAITASAHFSSIKPLVSVCDVIFITTPDNVLPDIDNELPCLVPVKNKTWLHTSGAHSSSILAQIAAHGGNIGSIHPLQSFGEPHTSAKQLEKTFFTIEGMPEAITVLTEIMHFTNGTYCTIPAANKALYHAGASILSNYLTTLINFGIECLQTAGINKKTLLNAVLPLITGTLANIKEESPVNALTGPIVRNDINTITAHINAINASIPDKNNFYQCLALETISMIEGKRLTHVQADKLRKLFGKKITP